MVAIGQDRPSAPISPGAEHAEIVRVLRDLCISAGAAGGVSGGGRSGVVPTGLSEVDAVLPRGGLDLGGVHEWMGVGETCSEEAAGVNPQTCAQVGAGLQAGPQAGAQNPRTNPPGHPQRCGSWGCGSGGSVPRGVGGERGVRRGVYTPPLGVLGWLAGRAVESDPEGRGRLIWVGPAVWGYPPALVQAGGWRGSGGGQRPDGLSLVERSLFVRARGAADRLWAADVALRSGGASAVIADGSGFDLASTRRLQLAAEAGGGVCLLARPSWERAVLSAASTRWMVRWEASPTNSRRWGVELLRCKGLRPTARRGARDGPGDGHVWVLERDHATRDLRVVPDLAGGSGVEETPAPPARRVG